MMTRREWLNRVLGATVAAAVAPLVDLTDMTPAFWQQPALRDVLPWRIQFPDGVSYTFNATVLEERLLDGGGVEFRLQPSGPMRAEREFREAPPQPGDTVVRHEPAPSVHGTTIVRGGVPIGELVDISVPELTRAPVDGKVLGTPKPEPVTFRVDFR